MSSYPILGGRPIDQWKVTELKEELKRRKFTTRGLKDDLIRRLDEALRVEKEKAVEDIKDDRNGDSQHQNKIININLVPPVDEAAKNIGSNDTSVNLDDGKTGMNDERMNVDADDSGGKLNANFIGGEILDAFNSAREEDKQVVATTIVETAIAVTENLDSSLEMKLSQKDMTNNGNKKIQLKNGDPKPQLENEDKPQLEGSSVPQLENETSNPQLVDQEPVPLYEDVLQDSSNPTNQVSEVSPDLGFQVKTDSISTDSVSIIEKKNELKDNIIADNLKLELDVIKPDTVEPSSSNVAPDGGQSHPMDVEESLEKKVSAEERNASDLNLEINKKTDNEDVGYPEKLNLDRSSGEESMEEDVIESRQIDSKNNSEQIEVNFMKEEVTVDIVGDDAASENKHHVDNKKVTALIEKRKLQDTMIDEIAVENNEPSKRQRRWNSEGLKLSDSQSPSMLLSSTPKDASRAPVFKRSFSRSDSAKSDEAPKERVVPASSNPPTNSLKIDRFLRPFTLKAVQELLGKTGNVVSFWMDNIKTHCYVTYSSVEEAIETRNAVYNLQWPANGGRLLVAEFVDPQEVKMRVEAPAQVPTTPVSAAPPVPLAVTPKHAQPSPQQSNRQQQQQHQLPVHLPPPPPLSNPPSVRERLAVPPPAPSVEKVDPPIVTLDDLFRKTKAIPRIYYLPLSDEQVTAKLAARGKSTN